MIFLDCLENGVLIYHLPPPVAALQVNWLNKLYYTLSLPRENTFVVVKVKKHTHYFN